MKPPSRPIIAPAVTALFAVVCLAATMSSANAESWCRTAPDAMRSCGFASKQQCLDMTSGRGGMCDPDPLGAQPGRAYALQPRPGHSQGAAQRTK